MAICKILIVEDNEDIRQLLTEVLDNEGYRIDSADRGDAMRRKLAADVPDVVIIDVALPGGDTGFALAAHARDRGCGVILVTGNHEHAEALAASSYRYALKPFRIEVLLRLVEAELEAVRARCTRPSASRAEAVAREP